MKENKQNNKIDSQSRNWMFVVNNPKLSEQTMFDYLKSIVNVKYFVFVREKGDGTQTKPEGTEHHQGYIEFTMPKKFSTMKGLFSADKIGVNAHISPRLSNRKACIDYVKKQGTHADKAHTQIGQVYEFGNQPQQGKRNDIDIDLVQMVEMKAQGFSDVEIFRAYPHSHARYYTYVNKIATDQKTAIYKKQNRKIEVTYIYGKAGVGKTSFVMNKYGAENVCRITDYGPTGDPIFDNYSGQDVIVFEEFRSSIKIEKILNYLDIYPLTLRARYYDRDACYTKVYILTNIPIYEQYPNVLECYPETWNAFLRRINKIYNFDVSKTKPEKLIKFNARCTNCNLQYVVAFNEKYGSYYGESLREYESKQQITNNSIF